LRVMLVDYYSLSNQCRLVLENRSLEEKDLFIICEYNSVIDIQLDPHSTNVWP